MGIYLTSLYHSRSAKPDKESTLGVKFSSFADLLARSDVVIVTCTLNDSTRGLFNMDAFKRMKSTAVVINISRGAVVEQDDLIVALKVERIYDYYSSPTFSRMLLAIILDGNCSETLYGTNTLGKAASKNRRLHRK